MENNKLPEFIKIYGKQLLLEGWGLYCENSGEYKTPESYFGKLVLEMIRALQNFVVDTGMHCCDGANKCFKYFNKHGFDYLMIKFIHNQLDICKLTHALAYKMGEKG